jgi:hypothetical protein
MEPRTVLLIAVPLIFAAAVFLVFAATRSHARSGVGSLGREAGRADRSVATPPARQPDRDQEARTRFDQAKASLEPVAAGSDGGWWPPQVRQPPGRPRAQSPGVPPTAKAAAAQVHVRSAAGTGARKPGY